MTKPKKTHPFVIVSLQRNPQDEIIIQSSSDEKIAGLTDTWVNCATARTSIVQIVGKRRSLPAGIIFHEPMA